MRIPFSLVLLLFFASIVGDAGCASNAFTVTLTRTARATGVTERYSVNQDGMGTKSIGLPADSGSKRMRDHARETVAIDRALVATIRGLLIDSAVSLAAIEWHDTGELTTGLHIDVRNIHHEITWANVDPPKLGTRVLDSLYHLMLSAEAEMVVPK